MSRVCRNLDWTPWDPSQPRTQLTWRRGWNQSSRNQSRCVGCAVVQENEVRSSLVAQSIPVRQQVTGQAFCVVLCGIRCPVNLHQLRLALLKLSPQILPPPPQAPCCASSNSAWLPMPLLPALSAITKMQNETVLAFWHCTFWCMKMGNYFFLTGLSTFNVTLTLTVCDCHDITLVAFWLNGWHLRYIFRNEIHWINAN